MGPKISKCPEYRGFFYMEVLYMKVSFIWRSFIMEVSFYGGFLYMEVLYMEVSFI